MMRTNTIDRQGTAYATVSGIKRGSLVTTDGGFTCMGSCETKSVEEDDTGLFIRCKDGQHYLDGQLSDDETAYVGLYPSDPTESL